MQIATNRTENDIIDAYWENLRSLSMKAKLRLASLLTTAAFEEECRKENVSPQKRLVRVKRRAVDTPSDAQLESQFAELEAPEIPEDPIWSAVINANTGKTIKPIETLM
jgi:hypothetical protein